MSKDRYDVMVVARGAGSRLATLRTARQGNRSAAEAFVRVTSGVTSPAELFTEDNLHSVFAKAG
jgi:hypothetical protein